MAKEQITPEDLEEWIEFEEGMIRYYKHPRLKKKDHCLKMITKHMKKLVLFKTILGSMESEK